MSTRQACARGNLAMLYALPRWNSIRTALRQGLGDNDSRVMATQQGKATSPSRLKLEASQSCSCFTLFSDA
jgi:hypothetical protein